MSDGLHRNIHQPTTLMELTSLVNSTLDSREIRRRAIEAATKLSNTETGILLLIDTKTGDLFFGVALGNKGNILKEIRLAEGQGTAGWITEKGETVMKTGPRKVLITHSKLQYIN